MAGVLEVVGDEIGGCSYRLVQGWSGQGLAHTFVEGKSATMRVSGFDEPLGVEPQPLVRREPYAMLLRGMRPQVEGRSRPAAPAGLRWGSGAGARS